MRTAMTLQEFLPWSGTAQAIGAMVHKTHSRSGPVWREVVCGQLFRSEYAAGENVKICVLASARGLLTLPNEGAPGGGSPRCCSTHPGAASLARGEGRREAGASEDVRSQGGPWDRGPVAAGGRSGSGTKFGGRSAQLPQQAELSAASRRGGMDWRAGSCGEV